MSNCIPSYSVPSDLLTIIITTSPVPSSPSPDLVKNTVDSLPNSLVDVPIIITFDNFTVALNERDRLKKGCASQNLADRYPDYIENVQKLFGDVSDSSDNVQCSTSSSLNRNVTFLILKKRNGFAFSVKIALDYVKTPYVMILQHDWLFTYHPPIFNLLSILKNEDQVQYIGFVARMSLNYETSKGQSHHYYRYIFSQARNLRLNCPFSNDLVACLHWFDRPHLCSVETYRQIFALPIVKRGDFIEDTFGTEYVQRMTNGLTKKDAFEEWKKWGAWLYYPYNGNIVTVRHQHGRKNLLGQREKEKVNNTIKSNINKSHDLSNQDIQISNIDNYLIDELTLDLQ